MTEKEPNIRPLDPFMASVFASDLMIVARAIAGETSLPDPKAGFHSLDGWDAWPWPESLA